MSTQLNRRKNYALFLVLVFLFFLNWMGLGYGIYDAPKESTLCDGSKE